MELLMHLTWLIALLPALAWTSEWNYNLSDTENGPNSWYIQYGNCGMNSQSPININDAEFSDDLGELEFMNFNQAGSGVMWELMNNGHSVQVTLSGSEAKVMGAGAGLGSKEYVVAQYHFHWGSDNSKGSEHFIDDQQYPMEMHIVCYNAAYDDLESSVSKADGVLVMGVLFQVGAASDIGFTVDNLGDITTEYDTVEIEPIDLNNLLPEDASEQYYRYTGSLTTPGCSEVVTWNVFYKTRTISQAQLEAFRGLYSSEEEDAGSELVNNFRPIQDINGRTMYLSYFVSVSRASYIPHQVFFVACLCAFSAIFV